MKARFKPAPILLAALVAAAFPVFAAPAAPAQSAALKQQAVSRKIVLTTGIKDGKMVFLGENGQANPTLRRRSATPSRSPSRAAKARSTTSRSPR